MAASDAWPAVPSLSCVENGSGDFRAIIDKRLLHRHLAHADGLAR